MGEDMKQPTPIDAEEYERFKQFVKEVHGRTRGHLASEIENALRSYREGYYGGNQLQRIEDDMAAIKSMMADESADGSGTPLTASDAESTRPRGSGKPASNQPREHKITWIIDEMGLGGDGGNVHPNAIRKFIESEYAFSEGTVDEYIEAIVSRLDAIQIDSEAYYWGEAIDDRYSEINDDTADEMEMVA